MSGSQARRGSPHGPIENEVREINHSVSLLSQIFHCNSFCLPMYMYFLFILLPHFVLIMYVPIL